MRFVAGRGAAAERLAGALQRRAIGKMLPAGALQQRAIGKSCWQGRLGRVAGRGRRGREWEAGTATSTSKESNLPEGSTIGKQARKEPQLQAGKEPPRAASEQKRERQSPLS